MKKVFVIAGDTSGDLISSQLILSMKKLVPDLHVTSCGGIHLEKVSDRFLGNLVRQQTFGFMISPQTIRFYVNFLKDVVAPELKANPPDVVIPVDFYGFNCRVARLAKKMGYRVYYYVSPQFWASRPGRANQLKPFVDLFLCLFPFEMEFYRSRNISAQFVGHPILDKIPRVLTNETRPRVELNIGLLPGSRIGEIERHLPVMLKACRWIHDQHPASRFILFTVPHILHDVYKSIIQNETEGKFLIDLVQDENYQWRSQLDLAITSSGMETLENAMLGIPMVIMYKVSWLNYLLARMIVSTPYIGLPNILAKEMIVPEFIQSRATPRAIAQSLLNWIKNPSEMNKIKHRLLSLRDQFGDGGASDRAARVILERVAS